MISVTEKAIGEVKRLMAVEGLSDPCLRVRVIGGGCSGMSYKLGFEETNVGESDKVFDHPGLRLVCDTKSYLFLNGTELDFSDGLNGTGFVFNNPNAKRTCGCGSSFSA